MMNAFINVPINIAVSSCLTGNNVRYDGSHKRNTVICKHIQRYFNLLEICPEMAIGLGVPRRPIIIVQDKDSSKLSLVDKYHLAQNYSHEMLSFAKQFSNSLQSTCALIVKERSPSCGLLETPRFGNNVEIISTGAGFFTDFFIRHNSGFPIISEFGIEDVALRDNFLERVFIQHLWNQSGKNKNLYQYFKTTIHHQLELRNSVGSIAELSFENTSSLFDQQYLDSIMAVLKIPVTLDMQVTFLTDILRQYDLESKKLEKNILMIKKRKITLWSVILQFQELFAKNGMVVNSNYFYPDKREVESRGYYFD